MLNTIDLNEYRIDVECVPKLLRLFCRRLAYSGPNLLHHPKAVVIPKSAVYGDTGNYFVKRLDEQKNKLVSTSVKIGHSLANGIEIINGLSPGDRIQRWGEVAPVPGHNLTYGNAIL